MAACIEGQCSVTDPRKLPNATKCRKHDDCRIRAAACCECEAQEGALVSVSDSAAYAALVCAPNELASCAVCAPEYPKQVVAFCNRGTCDFADPR